VRAYALSNELKTAPGEVSRWRKMFMVLLAASFFWISYVSQTHIHGQPQNSVQTVIAKVLHSPNSFAPSAPSKGGSDDPADCPLCQAVALGSMVLLPLLLVLLNLVRSAEDVPVFAATMPKTGFLRLSHQTRGPPSL